MSADGSPVGQVRAEPLMADPQDPLPESNWLWRRLLVFIICAVLIAAGWFVSDALVKAAAKNPVEALPHLSDFLHWNYGFAAFLLLLYMIAPSAEQIAKIFATLSAWKGGISTAVSSKVDATKGTAETKTVVGPVAAKPDDPGIPDYAKP